MKKLLLTLTFIMILALVSAQVISVNKAIIVVPENTPTRFAGNITFTIDGKEQGSCYINEPNMDIDDDFEACLKAYAGKTITNIEDWTGREYEEALGVRSFDIDKYIAIEEEKIAKELEKDELGELEGFEEW